MPKKRLFQLSKKLYLLSEKKLRAFAPWRGVIRADAC